MDKLQYNTYIDNKTPIVDLSLRLKTPAECCCTVTEYLCDDKSKKITTRIGWISGEFEIYHPDFGKVVPCICTVQENQNNIIKFLWGNSGLTQLENNPTFDTFDFKKSVDSKLAFDNVYSWGFVETLAKNWLLLTGNYGLGKTHLCKAITVALVSHKLGCTYLNANEFIEECKSSFNVQGKYDNYIRRIKASERLIIDDLGQEYATDWTRQVFYDLIDYRYSRDLPTIFTTNKAREQLEHSLGGATVDRIYDMNKTNLIEVRGESVRLFESESKEKK